MTDEWPWTQAPGRERLVHGWALCGLPAASATAASQADAAAGDRWTPMDAPGTVAAVLQERGLWSLDGPPRRFDAEDWWYRIEFDAPSAAAGETLWLGFDGLAGPAELWLDGALLHRSESMFVAHEHALTPGRHVLHLCFPALDRRLAERRPRPRWRAPMVEHQQLRWLRTSLLGRTPGWSPPAAAVGPWRDVWIRRRGPASLQAPRLRARVDEAGCGVVDVRCNPWAAGSSAIDRIVLELERHGRVHRAELTQAATAGAAFEGRLSIPAVERWWPHTHGEPALYSARLRIGRDGDAESQVLPLAPVGFRSLALDASAGGFTLRVNDVPIFCRGACWMPLDVVALRASPSAYRAAVLQARDAGMNMLRVSGATVYEAPAFFAACDEAGVLVWQDLMFANMDYPGDDEAFMASVRTEVEQQLLAWQPHACVAVVCGNSEVEQQAAMWGAPRSSWQPTLFHETLPALVGEHLPDVPYWPSSAHGGAFPHQSDVGTSSYYGVGAYLRPLEDARRADVRFTTECLGFSNVPEDSTIARMPGGHGLRVHHPAWKARAPRDLGAGWDFEDVRDHYLSALFGVDPLRCRYADHERYLALSRAVTGEVMARAFAEWRRPGSRCGGALVWFLRDLWAGAGWGLVDDIGMPKAAYHHLKRALQPRAVLLTDEGGNGLTAHVVNERPQPLDGELRIALYGPADAPLGQAVQAVRLAARSAASCPLAAAFDGFMDLSWAYRFGPAPARTVHVRLCDATGQELGEAFHFPEGMAVFAPTDLGLSASLRAGVDDAVEIEVTTSRFALGLHVELEGHALDDNHFHLAPGGRRSLTARRFGSGAGSPLRGRVSALNADRSLSLRGGS
ncbi:glycoside hydrolase family 2 protein [uncultured Methylibium sp.]|uniref:glycoside hydrolase family 2 protein n=1 Tax=uncultured Methylibium sp. TaxID=381093 RepID=UPI0025DC9AB1|nr:glycoside hydrolase family 2 protein [uncultured Methylibium sp.]